MVNVPATTILFISNDPGRADALTACLGRGYRVLIAQSCEAVGQFLASEAPDFFVLAADLVEPVSPLFAGPEFADARILVLEPAWPAAERKRAEGLGVLIQIPDTMDYASIAYLINRNAVPSR